MANIADSIENTPSPLREKVFSFINKASGWLEALGFSWLVPLLKMAAGDNIQEQGRELRRVLLVPLLGILVFIGAWAALAPTVQTSLGAVPGPVQVWEQVGVLYKDHKAVRAKATAFYERQDKRNEKLIAEGKADKVKYRTYTGKPTYLDQILTSLKTVALGFLFATAIAVPLGIAMGLSSLWPTLINTALGVASVDKDLMNVGRVLQLPTWKTITKLVLPSSLPLIFTGLRLSLGVGWMVLIAAEMLAQNPGLGKFVWDEFQNGSSNSLAKIMVAVFTIGLIGFALDRVMFALQRAFTFSANR